MNQTRKRLMVLMRFAISSGTPIHSTASPMTTRLSRGFDMGVKVKGIREAQANLDRLIGDIKGRRVVRAMQSALLIGGAQAALYTPIDTSTLLNSQYRDISVNGSRITGRVGYSANYAVYVHDPNIPRNSGAPLLKKSSLPKGLRIPRRRLTGRSRRRCSYDASHASPRSRLLC